MLIQRRMKKSAIGASSVTLVPTTVADPQNFPQDYPLSQIVVSTNAVTPPVDFWGKLTTDGIEYEVIIRPVT